MDPTPVAASPWGPPPPVALTCPRCEGPASVGPEVQTCGRCQTRFLLRAGPLMDPSVRPPGTPGARELRLKAPGLLWVSMAVLGADAVGYGPLDPVLGRFPVDTKGLKFEHVFTIAVYRLIHLPQVIGFFLISAPLIATTLLFIILSKAEPVAFIVGVPLILIAAFHGHRTFIRRAVRTRIVGPKDRTLQMVFVAARRKRQRFHDELFSRCGIAPSELP